jgi:ATP-dependent exoDNAse (exonuclease V) beta subunit
MKSPRRFAEAPFEILDEHGGGGGDRGDAGVPVLLRGAIDLVFEEPDGWVLLDYKTDEPGAGGWDALAALYAPQVELYAKAWERGTGFKVKERGVYFTKGQKLVEIGPSRRGDSLDQGTLFG